MEEKEKYVRPKLIEFNLDNLNEVEQNTQTMNGTNVDWPKARAEYVNSRTMTLKDIAAKYGCAEITVRTRSAKEGWVEDRNKVNNEFVKVTTQENLRRQAKAAISFNSNCLDVAHKILRLAEKRVDEIAESEAKPESNELVQLARATKQAQEAGRLALGLSTDNKEINSKSESDVGAKRMDDLEAELLVLLGEDKFNQLKGEGK